MRRIQALALALFGMAVLGAGLADLAAAALPQVLPEKPAVEDVTVAKQLTLTTLAGSTISCGSTLPLVEFTKEGRLGPYHLHFSGCSAKFGTLTAKCNTAGDSSGIVLTLGEFHLVYDVLTPVLGVAILFLAEETTIECSALIKIKAKGNIACLVKPLNTVTTTFTGVCEQSSGDPKESFYTDSGVLTATSLLLSFNGGAFESAALAGEITQTVKQSAEIMG
jgi:hypothetical protein